MTISYEDMLGWSVPSSAPVSATPKQADIVAQPLQVAVTPLRQPPSNAVLWLVIGAVLGFILCAVLERDQSRLDGDRQEQVVPDDKKASPDDKKASPDDKKASPDDKKQVAEGRDMIFVTEVADNSSDTYEMDRLWDRIKEYAGTKKVNARRYDKEQGSAQRYITYAKDKNLSPPFVAFSKDGTITSVKSVKEMDAVLK